MNILGIAFGYHDASIALIQNDKVEFAIAEEMFSRIKHDNSFPSKSLEFCLKELDLKINDLDYVVYYENNLLKFNRIIDSSIKNKNQQYFNDVLSSWINEDKFDVVNQISSLLGIDKSKIISLEHHTSHAAAAFFPSGFEKAAILTIDGVGEYDTVTIHKGKNNKLEKLYNQELPNSLGLFYSAFTSFLGFEVNEGEYKVMGMAPYGKPIYENEILKTINIDKVNYEFNINTDYFEFLTPMDKLYKRKLKDLFGEPRATDSPFFTKDTIELAPEYLTEEEKIILSEKNLFYANIASSLQKVTEDIILLLVQKALLISKCKKICIAGGVGLNSVANGKVSKLVGSNNIFIQPSSGDGGSSLGAALYFSNVTLGRKVIYKQNHSFLGHNLSYKSIKQDIKSNISKELMFEYTQRDEYYDKLSSLLVSQNVIGWVNEKFEWGPRALGARSIIADPRKKEMKHIVNEKIKFRELFRPFAPSVLEEYAHEWFDIEESLNDNSPENFMLSVSKVRDEKKEQIPAVVHVDGTSRVQLVRKNTNPNYYALIKSFYEKTGVPILMNTSFNLKGEPIVRTIEDAMRTFTYSEMDYLAVYPFIVESFWKRERTDNA